MCVRACCPPRVTTTPAPPPPPPPLGSYPLAMMPQCGQKLKLDTQTFVGVQLQDGQFRSLQVEDAGWRAEGGEGPQLQIKVTNRRGGAGTSHLGRLPVLPTLRFLLLPGSLWAGLATASWTATPAGHGQRHFTQGSANSWLGRWRHAVGVKGRPRT